MRYEQSIFPHPFTSRRLFYHAAEALDILADYVYAGRVARTFGDDDIGETLCRFYKLLVHRLEDLDVTVHDHRHGTSAVDGVALYVAQQTLSVRLRRTSQRMTHATLQP